MALGTILIACPSCSCHAFARESHCPGCGAQLRASDGTLQRTAGAAVLGLTLAFSVACSSETGTGSTSSTTGAGGGTSTVSSGGGMGGFQAMSTYGVGPSSSGQGGAGGLGTTSSGQGGAGGHGGAGGSK